ncbi:MAG: hypothetical protein LBV17_10335 [Treponema sp.]|jgi:hypothetical protein|nr:hypothetical protein [Treponema sp.]
MSRGFSCALRFTLALFVFVSADVFAQNALYKPFTFFRVIQTEHFEIVFPKESESSARILAGYADRVYDHVSSLLGIEVPGRIPVSLSPHTDMFNGYYSMIFNHIVLYDTPLDIEWTSFKNNLENLFLHELTHAVSLNSRAPQYKFWHKVFGNFYSPAYLLAPQFMVEGVTVSFESRNGTGRANDPRTKQYLRQAVYENKFLTPFQASGVYDRPMRPNGYWYEYGGLFSQWLIQNYGMEKYAQLWQKMGNDAAFSFFVYRSDYYRIFKKVYDIDFLDAWKEFSALFVLDEMEINENELSPKKYNYFSEREYFTSGLVSKENKLYFIENSSAKIGVYDTLTGKTKTFNAASGAYDIDVSADGKVMLLSGYRYIEDRAGAIVTEHRTKNGHKTGRTIKGLARARYFRDGVIGLRSDLHNTLIVYENFKGESEVLFTGNENLMFSGPQAVDNDRIVFIAGRDGKRELWLYNYVSRELFKIENKLDDNKYWAYIRGLGVSQGKLFFSYNSDDKMYKLAVIDLETMQAVFNCREFSGGVFNPVSANGSVYYFATFVSRNSLMRFPEPADSFSGNRIDLRLVKLDSQNYKTENEPPAELATVNEPPYDGPSKPYIGLRYMNPFKLWFPMPLIRVFSDGDPLLRLDGGGIFSVMADPPDRNLIYFLVYYDAPYKMAMVDRFSWQNTSMGFPITLNFSDKVMEDGDDIYRYTNASITGSLNWTGDQWNNQILLGGGYVRNAGYGNGKSAYEWEKTGSGFYMQTGFVFSYRRASLQFSGASLTDSFEPRMDLIFRVSTRTRFPLSFTLFGAYDERGMNLHGVSNTFSSTAIEGLALKEYPNLSGLDLLWLGGGEIGIGLFSLEIQKNISHLYFNRFFGSLSVRNQIYDSKGHPDAEGIKINNFHLSQSLGLKLGIKTSFFPFVKIPVSVEPFVFGAWKFSNVITGRGFPWFVDVGISASF